MSTPALLALRARVPKMRQAAEVSPSADPPKNRISPYVPTPSSRPHQCGGRMFMGDQAAN
ncbi:MAG: hypothetical protein KDJ45_04855 [Hyphomicrobiaceae bacterium]|nr:hypothetical protein [Hyphomicrobiaceae bacterium]